MRTADGRRRYQTLDGLRGVAAILVMAFHASYFFGDHVPQAYLAVDFFFVLSGVVIASAYGKKLAQGLPPWRFFVLRSIRFYPLYAVGLLFGVLANLAVIRYGNSDFDMAPPLNLPSLGLALFMLPTFFSVGVVPYLYPFDGPVWSLAYEMLVNMLYAVGQGASTAKRLAILTLLSGTAIIVLTLWQGTLNAGYGYGWAQVATALARVLYSFSLGILIFQADKSWVPKAPPWLILGALVLVLAAEPSKAFSQTFALLSALLFCPLVVLLGSVSEPQGRLQSGLFSFLGVVSYGIYVIHYPLLSLANFSLVHLGIDETPWLGLGALLSITLLAWLLDLFLDVPLRRWLGKKLF